MHEKGTKPFFGYLRLIGTIKLLDALSLVLKITNTLYLVYDEMYSNSTSIDTLISNYL